MNHLCWMQSLKNCLEPLNGHGSSSLGKTCVWPIGFCILSVQLIGPFRQHFQNWYVYIILSLDYIHLKCRISCHIKKKKNNKYEILNIKNQTEKFHIWYTSYIISYINIYLKHVNKSTGQPYVLIFRRVKTWSNERNIHPRAGSTPIQPDPTADPCSGGSSCHTWIKDLKKIIASDVYCLQWGWKKTTFRSYILVD